MNNELIISVLQGRVSILTSQISALQSELDADNSLLTLAQNGYQSDQVATANAIATGIATALKPIQDAVASVEVTPAPTSQPINQ